MVAPTLVVALLAGLLTLSPGAPVAAQAGITAVDDTATVEPGRSVVLEVLANDDGLDPEDPLTIVAITVAPAVGTATLDPDRTTITYAAPLDFTGASLEYQIENGTGLTATATVTVDLESSCSDFILSEADGAGGLEAAIQAANACAGAQTIFLGPGQYVTSLDFSPIDDQLAIVGSDPTNRPEILNASAATFPVTFRVAAGVAFEARSLSFRDLDSITTFIDATTGATVIADDLVMVGSADPTTSNGVGAIHGSGATLDVRNTIIQNADGSGIVGVNSSSLVGENLAISGSGNSGIAVFGGMTLTGVEVFGNGRDGIEGSGVVTISDVWSYGNVQDGIEIVGGTPTFDLTRARIGVDRSGLAAGNERGVAGWGAFTLDDVTIANSSGPGIDLALFASASLSTTNTTLSDNGVGLELNRTAWTAASTSVSSTATDCDLNDSTVTDDGGNADTDGTCFVIPNTDPVAVDDTAEATLGQTITIDVLGNDSDGDGDPLTVTSVDSPNATVAADGSSIDFTATAEFVGETFTYGIEDGKGGTAIANVTVHLVCPDVTVTEADGWRGLADAQNAADLCPGAQTIFVEPGNYVWPRSLGIDDGLTIVGTDPANPPILTTSATGTEWMFRVKPGAGTFVARDLEIVGSISAGLLNAEGVETTLENIRFRGGANGCSVARPTSTIVVGGRLTLQGSVLIDSSCTGIEGRSGAEIVVLDSEILFARGDGIDATGGSVSVTSSQLRNNQGDGISTAGGASVRVDGSAIFANTGDGISVAGGSITVTSSTVGIRPDGGAGEPAGNGGVGVNAFFADLELTDAVVANNGEGVRASTDGTVSTTITRSTIRDNAGPGLTLGPFTSATTLTATDLSGNGQSCVFGLDATIVDGGGNTDDGGTCGFNTAPTAEDDSASVHPGETVTIDVLDNDGDADGDVLIISSTTSVNAIVIDGGRAISYTAPPDFDGEMFDYLVDDGRGGTAGASVTVTLRPPPGPPTAVSASLVEAEACDAPVELDAGVTITTLSLPPGWVQGRPELFYCLRVTNRGSSTVTEIRLDGRPGFLETVIFPDAPLGPGDATEIDLGSFFGVPDDVDLAVELRDELGLVVDSAATRIVIDAPPIDGAIDSWTTAGRDASSACNDSYSYDSNGVAVGEATVVPGSPTDMWLCVSMRNSADGRLQLHELIVDPALPDGIAPPVPFELVAEPGAVVQRIVGPVAVVLDGPTGEAGFDIVWQADAPPSDPLLSDLSRIRFVPASGVPIVTIETSPVVEGGADEPGEALLSITLRDPSTGEPMSADVTLQLSTEDRQAIAGVDYVATVGTVSFGVDGSQSFRVPLLGDEIAEPDESFVVLVGAVEGAQLVETVAAVTILDDDGVGEDPRLAVRVGRTGTAACDGELDFDGDLATGTLTLPAGGDPNMPVFVCATYTNTGIAERLVHRFTIVGADPADLPFAHQIAEVVAPGTSFTRVLGPMPGLAGSVQWEWTAYDTDFVAETSRALTIVESIDYVGTIELTAGILATEPVGGCDGTEPASVTVPWGQGPQTDGFEVWYCVSATNDGNTALPMSEIRLLGQPDEVVVPLVGVLGAGQTRRVLIGPVTDHPAGFQSLVSPRTIEWLGLGPGYVPRVDDLPIVTGAATVEVVESTEGAPLVRAFDVVVVEPGADEQTTATVTIGDGPGLDQNLAVAVRVLPAPGSIVAGQCGPAVDFVDPGTVGFGLGPGLPAGTLEVTICGDTIDEPDELLTVEVSEAGPQGAVLATSTITIVDDDGPLQVGEAPDLEFTERDFSVETAAVAIPLLEPAESAREFRISLDGDLEFVPLCELGGDIAFGVVGGFFPDFEIDAGATALEFDLSICFDRLPETTETTTMIIGDYATGVEITRFDVTVFDDDTFPVVVGVDGSDWEDDGDGDTAFARFDVVTPSEVPWTFDVAVFAVNAPNGGGVCGLGADFGLLSPPFTVPFGGDDPIESFLVPVGSCADAVIEDDFTVDVRLTPQAPPTPELGQPVFARVLVRDDDTPPTLPGVTQIEVEEGTVGASTTVDVSLPILEEAPAPRYGISVVPLFDSGDASFGPCGGPFTDIDSFVAAPREVFQGDDTLDLQFFVCADDRPEPDRVAWFHVMDDVGQKILATVVLTIRDDDPFVTGNDTSVTESAETATVTFDVESPTIAPLFVRTVDGTAVSGPIAPLVDYVALGDLTTGAITLRTIPGLTGPVDVDVSIIDDLDHEPDETFMVEIWTAPVGGDRVASATVTIVDDDAPPVVRVADFEVVEGPPVSLVGLLDESFDGMWPDVVGPLRNEGVVVIEVVEPPERVYDVTLRASGNPADTAVGVPECEPSVLTGLTDYIRYAPGSELTKVEIPPVLPGALIEVPRWALACGDLAVEGDESYELHVLDEAGAELASATVTIVDDDAPPEIVVADVSVLESEAEDATVVVTSPAYTPLWIRTVAGSATGDVDYQRRGEGIFGPLLLSTIPGRTGPVTIGLEVFDDPDHEPDETYSIEIWDSPFAGNRLASFEVTIVDDDAPPVVIGVDQTFDESDEKVAARFEVQRPGEVPTTLWAGIFSGTAIVDDDVVGFGPIPPTVTLPPGLDAPFSFPLTLIDDPFEEAAETFTVRLFDAPLLGNEVARAAITITDDDRDFPVLASPPPIELVEGSSASLVFQVVEKATPLNVDLLIQWAPTTPGVLVGTCPVFGTSIIDAGASLGTRRLGRNAEQFSVSVTACDNSVIEDDETFDIIVSTSTGIELARTSVTIVDEDRPPVLSVADVTIIEGDPAGPLLNPMFNTVGTITVDVLEPPARPYDVTVRTDGRGTAGLGLVNCTPFPLTGQSDALVFSRNLVITPDSTSESVELVLACANTVEHDERWYGIELVDGLGESGGVFDQARVTIVDDDGPTGGITITDATVEEGDDGERIVEVTVTVSGSTGPTNVDWSAGEIALGGTERPADAGSDFGATSGSLYFPPGGGSETIELTVFGDDIAEGDETFRVTISSPNGNVVDGEARVRIIDDDALRASVVDAVPVLEGGAGETTQLVYEVRLDSSPSEGTAFVRWATQWADGAPTVAGPDLAEPFYVDESDFVHGSGLLAFTAGGSLSQTVTIDVVGDFRIENDETVYLFLIESTNPRDPVIGDGAAVGVILNDDELDGVPPVITGADNVRVVLTGAGIRMPVTFDVTAIDQRDGERPVSCFPASGSLFAVGSTQVECTATDLEDNSATAQFTVTVDANGGGKVLIEDDDDRTGTDGTLPTAERGEQITVQGSGFAPGSTGIAELRSEPVTIGTFTADANGDVEVRATIPVDTPDGRHTVVLVGRDPDGARLEVAIPIVVVGTDERVPAFTG